MDAYKAPADIWQVHKQLDFNEPLASDDPRYVPTEEGRGDFSLDRLKRNLGIDPAKMVLREIPDKKYFVFCGHRGCGKSTELRRIATELDRPELFLVIFIDTVRMIDINNAQYPDVLLATATVLFERLAEEKLEIDSIFLDNLEQWFDERFTKHLQTRDFAGELKTKAEAKTGIPLLFNLFAGLTTSIRTNSTYKDELRRQVKNHYSQFANAFNELIEAANHCLQKRDPGRRILFITDGTDRMNTEDADCFFIKDVYQLQLVDALFIIAAQFISFMREIISARFSMSPSYR